MLTLLVVVVSMFVPTAIILLLAYVIIRLAKFTSRNRSGSPSLRPAPPVYVARSLVTVTEHRFYVALRRAVRRDVKIMVKVRLADLVKLQVFTWKRFNSIGMKHVDFVLCHPSTLVVLGVVELDDSSHQRQDRRERDRFVDEVLAQARIPVFHVPTAPGYDPTGLRLMLSPLWGGDPAVAADPAAAYPVTAALPAASRNGPGTQQPQYPRL